MYVLEWSPSARAELAEQRAFYRPTILAAIAALVHQAETETRNRKRLRAGKDLPASYPDPTWEVRVGAHRVLYVVEGQTVRILGVKLKGSRATGEIL
jgi:mRNA-degrading endonuclease RelE of RelBE toxin-antitoxin system